MPQASLFLMTNNCFMNISPYLKSLAIGLLIIIPWKVFITGAIPSPDSGSIKNLLHEKIDHLEQYLSLDQGIEIYAIPSVIKTYRNRNYNPVWERRQDIDDLITAIKQSYDHGLSPSDYHISILEQMSIARTAEEKVLRDIILTDAFLLLTSHIISGKTDPKTRNAQWHVVKSERNPITYIDDISKEPLLPVLERLYPMHINYDLLKQQLEKYRKIEAEGGWPEISLGAMLKPGMSDPRIPQIKARLRVTGEYNSYVDQENNTYDDELQKSVVKFQKKHGIEALGNIGPETTIAMNTPVKERIKTLEVNLERWRWLPAEFSQYYVLVNIANFELEIIDNKQQINHQKVIVGRAYRKTPVFKSVMEYLDINPTWTVPPTILRNDLVPEIQKNVRYLTDKNITVFSPDGKMLNPDSVNWNSNSVFSYTYRQKPGKSNALGRIKFMFPNTYNVYLHDTPTRELFNRTERAFSSGCIRVEKPIELAELLLADQGKWSQTSIKKAIETNKTQTIRLTRKPEVYLLYWTAWIDQEGNHHFSKDIYDRDHSIYIALNSRPVYDLA
ncbi:murein L,D-transpeptidase YcbB/YkuD [Marinilabilia salmonicolor]|jgi:murein L,D-transpeptidase YcbB/YkuD|uniref:Murein L,D-transpeptidase YcbB/YkuD n=2 Tax=Marinilabilia salmonicolor TaxID=989 RepID=A0A2T0XM02_9BACT|nr:murein L,D-transpeptidase YcbB/YkuD [Marinilabilia salmonicolor]RCW38562.1 murein L,D-transpeptidase YcbB/YkuD [Marinilabilia salmonicolor]